MIKNIGILGGGQLGKMLAIAIHQYGFNPHIYTDKSDSPAINATKNYIVADYDNNDKLIEFSKQIDVLTFEFENLPYHALDVISKQTEILPSKHILKIAQNRILEKTFLQSIGVNVANYCVINNIDSLREKAIDYPAILKTATLGYDGRGQKLLYNTNDIPNNFQFPAVLEDFVQFTKEVSIIVARNRHGKVVYFPVAENLHKNGILITSKVPANISKSINNEITRIANLIASSLDLNGILAIEFFIVKNEILVNELAPRAHNSGHWSMNCCNISQFDALTRIICNLPLPEINLRNECIMHNIIGKEVDNAFLYLQNKNAHLHLYGKTNTVDGRKMGHVNILL